MERLVPAQYIADYKAQAVSLAESLGAAKAARKLGISVKTLENWIRISRDGTGFVKDGKRRPVSDLEGSPGVSGTLCVTAQRCDDHRRAGEHAPLHGGGDFGSHPTPAPR